MQSGLYRHVSSQNIEVKFEIILQLWDVLHRIESVGQ